MGGLFSSLWNRLWAEKEYKILLVGLDNAGKTTTMYKLLLNEVVSTAPTIGSNVEEFRYRNLRFVMWDLGGQTTARASWATYCADSQAVIVVIDSSDRDRLDTIRTELFQLLREEDLKSAAVLIFANKQDLPTAMSAMEISDSLGLSELKSHQWSIQACCALVGDGYDFYCFFSFFFFFFVLIFFFFSFFFFGSP
jgi:ADP-ribosylation factor-like protein 5B